MNRNKDSDSYIKYISVIDLIIKNSDEKKVSDWISLGTSYTEKIVEIKNVDETKTVGTYYVFAKDAAGNIGKKEYIITAKDLEKETALDLGVNLKQEDTIIKCIIFVVPALIIIAGIIVWIIRRRKK